MSIAVSRNKNLLEKIVLADGLPGCGKTLLSPLLASMDRVEIQMYSFEIEHYCALYHLEKLPIDSAVALIKLLTDTKIYHSMMGREVNFRPDDLSSVFKYSDPKKYFKRILDSGDEVIPAKIRAERPILNLTVHNILAHSEPIWQAFSDRCVLVEMVRHPLYMIRQQELNMKRLIGTARNMTMYYSYNKKEYPYWVRGWEDIFDSASSLERSIHFMDKITKHTEQSRRDFVNTYQANIFTIPFEQFVLNPTPWMEKVANILDTNLTDATRTVMKEQNVPRDRVGQGIDLDIYKRCGWVPPKDSTTERDELNIRRKDVAREVSSDVLAILDRLSNEYEEKYWNPEV